MPLSASNTYSALPAEVNNTFPYWDVQHRDVRTATRRRLCPCRHTEHDERCHNHELHNYPPMPRTAYREKNRGM